MSRFNTSWVPRCPIVAFGRNLQDERRAETISYLSLAAPGCELHETHYFSEHGLLRRNAVPNFFHICGPYGPFAHGSYIPMSEVLIKNVLQVVQKMQKERIKSLNPKRSVCDEFAEHADLFVKRTAWDGPCSAWFKKGGGKNRLSVFPGSRLVFLDCLKTPRYEDYDIEYWAGRFQWLGNGFHAVEFNGGDDSWYLGAMDERVKMLEKREVQLGDVNGYSRPHE